MGQVNFANGPQNVGKIDALLSSYTGGIVGSGGPPNQGMASNTFGSANDSQNFIPVTSPILDDSGNAPDSNGGQSESSFDWTKHAFGMAQQNSMQQTNADQAQPNWLQQAASLRNGGAEKQAVDYLSKKLSGMFSSKSSQPSDSNPTESFD